jgi:hypothetical protein
MTQEVFKTVHVGDIISNKKFASNGAAMGWDYLVIETGKDNGRAYIVGQLMWAKKDEFDKNKTFLDLGNKYKLFQDEIEECLDLRIKFKHDLVR